jgi:hypothetical protein
MPAEMVAAFLTEASSCFLIFRSIRKSASRNPASEGVTSGFQTSCHFQYRGNSRKVGAIPNTSRIIRRQVANEVR